MLNIETDDDHGYDVPAASPYFAYESEETAKNGKRMFEEMNNADDDGYWEEDDYQCYFTIEETDLITDKE